MRNTYQIIFYVLLFLKHLSHVCINIYKRFVNNETNICEIYYCNKAHKVTNVFIMYLLINIDTVLHTIRDCIL